jgi:predicted polyphosphate/ATP-dependent NAD kinase
MMDSEHLPARQIAKRLGLIVNPVAGLGGRVGLKGSDGLEIQQLAREMGAVPAAGERALQTLRSIGYPCELLVAPLEMGESIARQGGFSSRVIGEIHTGFTTAQDTRDAAQAMLHAQVDLMLFAGGDGTARDIYQAVGTQLPCLGIPAGVKIHSGVFALNPQRAGELASEFLDAKHPRLKEAEVIDLDEASYRSGRIATALFGYLKIPYHRSLVQNQKAPSPAYNDAAAWAIAEAVVESMQPGWLYILGPGTTTRAIAERLGFPKTLVGVDVVCAEAVVAVDVGEQQLLELVGCSPAKIVVSPIGGQGFIFGRGSQPISPAVIQKVGWENILIVSSPEKLAALHNRPLLVDSGDEQVDRALCGYLTVITGYRDRTVYRVSA